MAEVIEPAAVSLSAAIVLEHLRALLPHRRQITESCGGCGASGLRINAARNVGTHPLLDVEGERGTGRGTLASASDEC